MASKAVTKKSPTICNYGGNQDFFGKNVRGRFAVRRPPFRRASSNRQLEATKILGDFYEALTFLLLFASRQKVRRELKNQLCP